jgi:hypothetical protein
MDFILQHYESAKEKYSNDPYLAPIVNLGWAKIDKYYRLTD